MDIWGGEKGQKHFGRKAYDNFITFRANSIKCYSICMILMDMCCVKVPANERNDKKIKKNKAKNGKANALKSITISHEFCVSGEQNKKF